MELAQLFQHPLEGFAAFRRANPSLYDRTASRSGEMRTLTAHPHCAPSPGGLTGATYRGAYFAPRAGRELALKGLPPELPALP
jgi:hypothetical protein